MKNMFFCSALPVFEKNKEEEMNHSIILRGAVPSLVGAKLYITAASFYRLCINGIFVSFGPARTAKGYARVDEIALERFDGGTGENIITIEAAGYHCGSLATVKQPSFVLAELRRGGEVLLATGRDFEGYRLDRRVRKVERYSVQRHFGEIWDYTSGEPFSDDKRIELSALDLGLSYLPSTPAPSYRKIETDGCVSYGGFVFDPEKEYKENFYSWKSVPKEWGRFERDELFARPYEWFGRQRLTKAGNERKFPIKLSAGEYALFDLGMIYAGFLSFSLEATDESDVVVAFTELCGKDAFEFTGMKCQNVIEYLFPRGATESVMSFEPYTAKCAVVTVKSGEITLTSFGLTTYEHDPKRILPHEISDPALGKIYDAAVRSFTHNSLDIYMDCPSRERAGWLGDTYFTSKGEYYLTGKSAVEDAFLENYRLYEYTGGDLPRGVLPECYPSDIEGNFIPQWDMWYVLEVCDYLICRRPDMNKELFRKSIYDFLAFLEPYENSDGLLQNLPSWNFVEWSRANTWVQDVNYPTNFLYAEALKRTALLYGDATLADKSKRIRETAKRLSWNGEIFIDNAQKDEHGVLHNTENFSEAGQYYALLFGDIDLADGKYDKLRSYIDEDFIRFYPDKEHFVRVNVWIGFYLKMELFIGLGAWARLDGMIRSVFPEMAEETGTLWEYRYDQRVGSYDHGFSAYVAYAIGRIEEAKKQKLF